MIPWNSGTAKWNRIQFHGIPSNCETVILINTMLPLTCMAYFLGIQWKSGVAKKNPPSSQGIHGIRRAPFQMTQVFHGIPWNIPWNSMELWFRQMKYNLVPWNSMEYSMEFHGTLVPPNEISLSSMKFHGIFRGIPWNSGTAKWNIT